LRVFDDSATIATRQRESAATASAFWAHAAEAAREAAAARMTTDFRTVPSIVAGIPERDPLRPGHERFRRSKVGAR
jgi:hypothetical protein